MSFKDIALKTEYRSRLDNVIQDFYIPVLKQAVIYKRAVGFFSSSALSSLTVGICGLINNGGSIQIIASPHLSREDIDAINYGLRRRDDVIKETLIRELKEPTGNFEKSRLNFLSNLIAANKLEIKIAFLEDDNTIGMFHEKLGLMYDGDGNIIAFSGSMNESANAFTANYESIDIFTSWTQDIGRVKRKESAFNSMWKNYERGIKVLDFPEVNTEILQRYKINNTIDTKLDDEIKSEIVTETFQNAPVLPKNIHMRQYQLDAIEEWTKQNYVGIFDMATGTGKTFTALAAVAKLFSDMNQNLAVIIICPYQHLVEQWKNDIINFGMKPIICYSASSQKDWRERLKTAVTSFNLGIKKHFCMVSTNATFSTDYVQKIISKLTGKILIVVDEAHNFGAEKLSKMLLPNIPFRIALSATIDRHGDFEGTQKLYDYFGKKCIEYTLKDAINNGMLTPYYYYPVAVSLNEDELSNYLELTTKIGKNIYTDKNGKIKLTEYVKMLLIKRARIVAGAAEKINTLRQLMKNYKDDNKILVYCGATTMHDVDYQEGKPPIDEARQIDIVAEMLGNEIGMRVTKFTSEENAEERERIKADFSEGKHLQALIAIRCLDEGVNIPSIKTAFIMASSTNPKEYIQRRGRVLRKSPGKSHAVIFDFITLPLPFDKVAEYDSEILNSVNSLAKREILRMKDFAEIAENPFDSDSLIAKIKKFYDVESDAVTVEAEKYV